MEKKEYVVKIIHKFYVEAESEEEACKTVWEEKDYGNASDCYLEIVEKS